MRSSVIVESDNIYVNLSVINSKPSQTAPNNQFLDEDSIPAVINFSQTTPILNRATDYYCSIIRFDMPLFVVPITICPIVPNQPNPNLTPMVIGISYNGTNYSEQVIFYTFNNIAPPIQNQQFQVITQYYFMYDYEQLVNMVNIALKAAWTSFVTANPAAAVYQAPFYLYDAETQLIDIIVPEIFLKVVAPLTAVPVIFQNEVTTTYFDAFTLFFNGLNQPFGRDYDLRLVNPLTNQSYFQNLIPYIYAPLTTGGLTYYIFEQNYQTISTWTSLKKLIISSNTIPIRKEYLPSDISTGLTNQFPVMTDFVPNVELPGQGRLTAYYYPTGPYKLVDMNGDYPLTNIDIKVYWQDKLGNFYPLTVACGQELSIKIAFFRKDLYKQNKLLSNV